ncbi:uncharacterized protein LOC125757798 [Rhipicephalus sanguineus]|uniref:uncharacterized protein LOC125757798 n=1 Tax=Rhipicephalus sanguineus TaxID=34632 RepID=UPI0020C2DAA6|nr:uncharacterized protein LOC125757798 [Rhipicephalus sanguineus]
MYFYHYHLPPPVAGRHISRTGAPAVHLRAAAPNKPWCQHTVEDEPSRGASFGRSASERGGVEQRLRNWNLDEGRRCEGLARVRRGYNTRYVFGYVRSSNDYRIVLPRLPTGKLVADSVFLHADLAGRPYRAQDFRDALRNIIDLADITSIGQFQMSHVWMVTCRTALSKVKLVTCGEFFVRGRRCVVIDPEPTEVKMKLLWLPERLEDIYVHEAFQPFGKIKSISAETWRVSEMEQMRTLNRDVVLALGDGVRVSDIPHLLSVCGLQSLVLIPGRPPLCLRCNKVGHIRRHCRTPRCEDCRRFGHTAEECVATYANKLRHRMRPPEDAFPEHIMDATEVLDATGDLPHAAVAEPCAVDKDAASDCAGAENSKQASNTVDVTDSGEKEAVPAHDPEELLVG